MLLPWAIDSSLDALGLGHGAQHPAAAGGVGYGLAAASALSRNFTVTSLANVMDEPDAAIGGRRDEPPFLHHLVDGAVIIFRNVMGRNEWVDNQQVDFPFDELYLS